MHTFAPERQAPGEPDRTSLPTVSVVVPSCQRRAQLGLVVSAILESQTAQELIVALSGPDDGSREMIESLAASDPRVTVLPVDEGDAMAARAAGSDIASGEVVLFLDDDVVPVGDISAVHARAHRSGPGQVVLGYMPVWSEAGRPPVASRLYGQAYEQRVSMYEESPANVFSYFWAGNFSVRREDVERVGLWSSDFERIYHEDRDLGLRCGALGLRPRFLREAEARHLHDRSMPKFLGDSYRHGVGLVRLERVHGRTVGLDPDERTNPGRLISGLSRLRLTHLLGRIAGAGATAADRLRSPRLAEWLARVGRRLWRDAGIAAERRRPGENPAEEAVSVRGPEGGKAGWRRLASRLWSARELALFFAIRDLKIRYRQTALGLAWVALQPLLAAALFTAILGRVSGLPSDGLPYVAFVFSGLIVWIYVSRAVDGAANSLLIDRELVTKVSFPRLLAPLAAVLPGLLDIAIWSVLLAGILIVVGVSPSIALVSAPVWLLAAALIAFGIGSLLAALHVQYRDIGHGLAFALQLWFFATPVIYASSIVGEPWRLLYGLNPLVGLTEGFRWAVVAGPFPGIEALPGLLTGSAALIVGVLYFHRVERRMADVI